MVTITAEQHAAYYLSQTQPWRCIARDAAILERMGIYYQVVAIVELALLRKT